MPWLCSQHCSCNPELLLQAPPKNKRGRGIFFIVDIVLAFSELKKSPIY
ncbi:MAG: hypothetical protein ACJAUP_001023 [Cellvibrionaceae bacterium]|jgi:hypothetical protein